MDKVTVFETVDVGSIPTEGTRNKNPLTTLRDFYFALFFLYFSASLP